MASWLAVADMLALFILALTWIAAIAGLSATSVDGAGAFAENQPVTAIVDTLRTLLSGQSAGPAIWIALAWCVGIMLVAYVVAMRVYQKRA